MVKNVLFKRERAQLEANIALVKESLKGNGLNPVGFKIAAGYADSLKGLLFMKELSASRRAYALNLAWFLAGAAVMSNDAPTIEAAYRVLAMLKSGCRKDKENNNNGN